LQGVGKVTTLLRPLAAATAATALFKAALLS
jgi:hypothetical protein